MPAKHERETIGVDEAAAMIGVNRRTAIRLYNDSKLDGYRVTEGLTAPIRIYRDSVVAYVKRVQHRSIA